MRGQDRGARVVLRGDQAERGALALRARSAMRVRDLGIGRLQRVPVATKSFIVTAPLARSPRSARASRSCRPPSNGVASHSRTISFARARATIRAPHRQHVRVVVLARQPRRVQVVAERRPDAVDLVRRDLLALPGTTERRCRARLVRRRPRAPPRRRTPGSPPAPSSPSRRRSTSWPSSSGSPSAPPSAGTRRDRRPSRSARHVTSATSSATAPNRAVTSCSFHVSISHAIARYASSGCPSGSAMSSS